MIKKVDWHSKVLWTSMTALVIVLVQQVAKVFGIEFSNDMAGQIQGIVNTVLTILGLVGVIYDTTKGDSNEKIK
ncbi:phage holin [Latilactobacillus fuchuensis]|uniref:phage holin n=1 Tax=Latilactobacillus fuchuensis TaxID=164393 RepID=UPI0039AF9C5F